MSIVVYGLNARFIGSARTNCAAQLGAQFFGDRMRVYAVCDDLGTDEDDQFSARLGIVLVRECIAYPLELIQPWYSVSVLVPLVLYQPGQQHRLSVSDRNRAFHPSLRYGRRQRCVWIG